MTTYIGTYGHSFHEDGNTINWQFNVTKELPNKRFIVTTFSWLTGDEYSEEVITEEELLKCRLYTSAESMISFYEILRSKPWNKDQGTTKLKNDKVTK